MPRNLPNHPTMNETLTLTTYEISATAANDTVTVASNDLETGREVIVVFDGGTANGITSGGTYYWIRVNSTSGKLATTLANALAGTAVDVSGDAGAGDLYPVYSVRGFVYVGIAGSLNLRGRESTTWSLHKGLMAGSVIPFDVSAIHSYANGDSAASGLVVWY